ncbi:MAG: Outer membrane protein assembly factor BamD [Phycisphaerae bacterium]|nr:Outer membrane protein assembly factor BamD [Phycisphaerae bacterium]
MNRTSNVLAGLLVTLLAGMASAQAQTLAQLQEAYRQNPTSPAAVEPLAEAYLRDCRLEESLALFRDLLKLQPDNARAKLVVDRLTTQSLDLDSHLAVLDRLLDKGITQGMEGMLDAAAKRAATNAQKARVLYLRGRLGKAVDQEAAARASYESTMRLYPHSAGAGLSAIALASLEEGAGRPEQAIRLLDGVVSDRQLADDAVRQMAAFRLAETQSEGLGDTARADALAKGIAKLTDPAVKRKALRSLLSVQVRMSGWTPAAVATVETFLRTAPPADEMAEALGWLDGVAQSSRDKATLEAVLTIAAAVKATDPASGAMVEFLKADTLLGLAAIEEDSAAVARLVAEASESVTPMEKNGRLSGENARGARRLAGKALLLQGQKLVTLGETGEASPVLLQARDRYLAMLADDPDEAFARLTGIGGLLEQVGELEMAVALYRRIETAVPATEQGRDALYRVAWLYDHKFDAPMLALDAYAEYAARYPAELAYRQLAVGERLRRVGYVNLLDFQNRNNLKPDGVFGPLTRQKLEELETNLSLVAGGAKPEPILRGQFVHPQMFAIAQRLAKAGRDDDAIRAYLVFLSLFPGKQQADECLLGAARCFRANLLFAEALGAYRRLMEDYPKGNVTSTAYVEAAACLENLGRWKEARELYELYARKFPKYAGADLCRTRMGLLDQVIQYEDFINTNPNNPKQAEAQYQLASLLYKEFKNYTKAATEFAKVAQSHPQHVRAADALFTAGSAQMRAENFPAARELFAKVVADYPDSRLADDAQYWIGHTYEYAARALGKLDAAHVVIRRRSLGARAALLSDVGLRRIYNPDARAGQGQADQAVWGGDTLGVLASGSVRDRVNADLRRAIQAYRQVVAKFKTGDMADDALLAVGTIYTDYLHDADAGLAAYRELLEHYPGSQVAVEALFQVGAYQVDKKQYDQAIQSYQQFIYNYPNAPKVQDAMIAVARCWADKKAWDKALDAYQAYLGKFPEGTYAQTARSQVEWIRMYHF